MRKVLAVSTLLLFSFSFWASATAKVVADIAPLHSLVSQVMDGVGTPKLLIQSGASPHSYSMRPSEARALSEAQLVFWISEGLTPWLEKSLDNIAGSATKVEMLGLAGTTRYDYREGATFEGHDHHDGHSDHDDHDKPADQDDHDHHHDHDKHDDHNKQAGHDDHEHHDDHDKHAGHDDHGHHHDHEGHDPHAWLDPVNAKVWVEHIAKALSAVDPGNASVYKQNAAKTIAKLDKLIGSIEQQAKKLEGIRFIVFHDAYQYFERRFGLAASGSISLGDASDPSPARIAEIRNTVAKLGVTCVFSEPQYNSDLVRAVFEKSSVSTIGVMDPLGSAIKTGQGHYAALLNAMIASLNQCKK